MDKALFNSKYAYELNGSMFYIDNGRICSDHMDIDDNAGYVLANLYDVKVIGRIAHADAYPDGHLLFTESDKGFINNEGLLFNVNNFEDGINYSDVSDYIDRGTESVNILDYNVTINWDLIQYLDLEDDALSWFINSFDGDPESAGYEIYNYEEICNWLDKYQINRDYTITDGKLKEIDLKISWDLYNMIHDALLVDNEPDYMTIVKINDMLINRVLFKI